MELTFRKCTPADLITLQALSRSTFDTAFRHLNTPENMAAYLDSAFDTEKLRAELLDAQSEFYFLYAGDVLAGYMRLNEGAAQSDLHDPASLELERIYVTADFQGGGLGGALMDKAMELARLRGKAYIWLGVWEKNERAIAFYMSHGFEVFDRHTFILGDEVQSDFMMRKNLDPVT